MSCQEVNTQTWWTKQKKKTTSSQSFVIVLTSLSQLMIHFPSRAVHCRQKSTQLLCVVCTLTDRLRGDLTCLHAVQNFLWKNSSFIWIPTAVTEKRQTRVSQRLRRSSSVTFKIIIIITLMSANTVVVQSKVKNHVSYKILTFLPATIGDFLSSRSWMAVLAKTTLLFSKARERKQKPGRTNNNVEIFLFYFRTVDGALFSASSIRWLRNHSISLQ